MNLSKKPTAATLAALTLALSAAFTAPASAGQNLIQNAGAEAGEGSPSGGEIEMIPSWTNPNDSNFTVVQYNASGFPSFLSPGPSNRGRNFFSGGPGNDDSFITQRIDLSFAAAAIAAGGLSFNLSGWLGGFESQNDHALLSATWFDSSSTALNSVTLNTVTAGQRENGTGMLFRSLDGFLPTNTTSVLITLEMIRTDGIYNDGYADNLSFSIGDFSTAPPPMTAAIPEPSTYALMLGGLAFVGQLARRRAARAATSTREGI